MLEEVIGKLEDFEDELEGDRQSAEENYRETKIEMNEYEGEDGKEKWNGREHFELIIIYE